MTSLSFLLCDFYTGTKNQTIFRREFVKTFFGEMKTILSHLEEEGFSQKIVGFCLIKIYTHVTPHQRNMSPQKAVSQ